jgi:hypothetical protein
LPPLLGTAKQIAWAETIRLKKITEVSNFVESWETLPESKRSVIQKPAHMALKALGPRLSEPAKSELQTIASLEDAAEEAAVRLIPETVRGISSAEWWIIRRRWRPPKIVAECIGG